MDTTLFDLQGEEVARRITHRDSRSASYMARRSGQVDGGGDDSQSSDWSLMNLFGGRRSIR